MKKLIVILLLLIICLIVYYNFDKQNPFVKKLMSSLPLKQLTTVEKNSLPIKKMDDPEKTIQPMAQLNNADKTSVLTATQNVPNEIHAVVSTETMAAISSPMAGLITKIFVKDGSVFKKGEVLLQFDCREQLADLEKANAAVKFAQVNKSSYARLAQLGSASKMKVAESFAEFEKAKGNQAIAQKHVSDCEIKAPYDGRITELSVHQDESVQLFQHLFDIMNNDDLVVKVLVPSDWLGWLKIGSTFQLKVSETGKNYTIKVERMVERVDAVSQTVKIIGKFVTPPTDLTTGMSGDATFEKPNSHHS